MEESKVIHEWVKTDATKKVKLMKMSKDNWQWGITYEETNSRELLDEIYKINDELIERFKKEDTNEAGA